MSLLFSMMNSPSSFSLSLQEMLQSLHHLSGPLSDCVQYVPVFLPLWGLELDTVLQVWLHQS